MTKPGDPRAILFGERRLPAEVVGVLKEGKTLVVRELPVEGEETIADLERSIRGRILDPDPTAPVQSYTLRINGEHVLARTDIHRGPRLLLGVRQCYNPMQA